MALVALLDGRILRDQLLNSRWLNPPIPALELLAFAGRKLAGAERRLAFSLSPPLRSFGWKLGRTFAHPVVKKASGLRICWPCGSSSRQAAANKLTAAINLTTADRQRREGAPAAINQRLGAR